MTEILTESFCERCGTRYTFESVAPRQRRLGRMRILGSGLKNFVMSDSTSLDEAMAAARSDAEREATSQQLDAFHRTFNFCMSCRQYTCGNCWNTVEGRCLSCSPLAIAEMPETAFGGLDAGRLLRVMGQDSEAVSPGEVEFIGVAEAAAAHAHAPVAETEASEADEAVAAAAVLPDFEFASDALPAIDAFEALPGIEATAEIPEVAVAAEPEAVAEVVEVAEPEPVAEVVEVAGPEAVAEVAAAEPAAPEAAAEPAAPEVAAEPAAPEAEAEAGLLGLEPGESLEDAIAAYEASLAEAAPSAGPGIDVVEQPTWAMPPTTAEVEAAPEPTPVAAAEIAPPAPEPVAPVAPAAATPEAAPPVAPAPATPPIAPAEAPQWPTGPRWPTAIPAHQPPPPTPPTVDPLTALMARHVTEAMWAASSRDVVQPPVAEPAQSAAAVQPCVSCGISLSARARFCRRCGTSQDG